jgi:hypothetical protein
VFTCEGGNGMSRMYFRVYELALISYFIRQNLEDVDMNRKDSKMQAEGEVKLHR